MKKIIALTLSLLLASPVLVQAESRGFVNLGIGSSKDKVLDETATSLRAGVGTTVMQNLTVEAEFVYLGTLDFGTVELSQSGGSVSISPFINVGDNATVFLKLGLLFWRIELSSGSASVDNTGTDAFGGIGMSIGINDKTSLVVEYDAYTVADGDVNLITVGGRFAFD